MHNSGSKVQFGLLTEAQSAGVLDPQAREDSEYVVKQAILFSTKNPLTLRRLTKFF
jgi:hypothetical protein